MNGKIVSYIHHDGRGGALLEVFTDTDFAANTESLGKFGKWIAMLMYGYQVDTWEKLLETDNPMIKVVFEQIKKELKEDVKVGRCTILQLGKDKVVPAVEVVKEDRTVELDV